MKKVYKLADRSQQANLLDYQQEIINTINAVTPGKNPKVYADHFEIDVLTHKEAVALGRALSRVEGLQRLGKQVTIFRLFQGSVKEY